jgi:RNA polymerase sigma factor (TIGR02999 family)
MAPISVSHATLEIRESGVRLSRLRHRECYDAPMSAGEETLTVWLAHLRDGRQDALDHIVPLVYEELRRVARGHLRHERLPHALSATTLVHEAYLRLLQQRQIGAVDRGDFVAVAGLTMRRVLVDEARRRNRAKRGGAESIVPLDDEVGAPVAEGDAEQLLALDGLLERLASLNERAARIVEYRVFAGLTLDETAAALDMSVKTVQRTWSTARAWLRKELAAGRIPA